jgi:uncharacterized protein YndB with AHSA1/START domain
MSTSGSGTSGSISLSGIFTTKIRGRSDAAMKTIEVRVDRTICAPPGEVFDAWLDPKTPGTPWNMGDKMLLNPHVDGLFYMIGERIPHYGRFTEMEMPAHMKHTWVSPNTLGEESKMALTFQKQGEETLMPLVHLGLPDTEAGRGHERGWNYFLDTP